MFRITPWIHKVLRRSAGAAPAAAMLVAALASLWSAEPADTAPPVVPKANVVPAPDEPLAAVVSLAKAAEAIDNMAVAWTHERKCAHCHTNLAYLVARPALKEFPTKRLEEIREFLEQKARTAEGNMLAAIAPALAIHDARTSGRLSPAARSALDRLWKFQRPDGAWPWFVANYAPTEMSEYYGAVWVALGLGLAPDGYAQCDSARNGLARLRAYLQVTPAPNLHDTAWLLWAATRLDGLMSQQQKQGAMQQLLALQQADGGWALPSLLVPWKGRPRKPLPNDPPSDGYATGLVVYVLRQSGLPANPPQLQRGLAWLKSNQRTSGHWLTPSPNSGRNLVVYAGTCFAVLAILEF